MALIGMILILVGLHHYIGKYARRIPRDDQDMDDTYMFLFKREVDEKPEVISRYNLFRSFLEKDDSRESEISQRQNKIFRTSNHHKS